MAGALRAAEASLRSLRQQREERLAEVRKRYESELEAVGTQFEAQIRYHEELIERLTVKTPSSESPPEQPITPASPKDNEVTSTPRRKKKSSRRKVTESASGETSLDLCDVPTRKPRDKVRMVCSPRGNLHKDGANFSMTQVKNSPMLSSAERLKRHTSYGAVEHSDEPADLMRPSQELLNCRRVFCSGLYRVKDDIEMRQSKPTPKKYKQAFLGSAAVSYMLEWLHIANRSLAVVLGNACMDTYLVCVNDPEATFLDSEMHYYEFKFSMLMFTEKLDTELRGAVDTLLQAYGRTELLRAGPSMTEPSCTPVTAQNKFLMRKKVEICTKWKGKKWVRRLVILRHNALVLHKGEEENESGQEEIALANIKNISVDESQYDLMDLVRKSSTSPLDKILFVIRYQSGQEKRVMFLRCTDDVQVAIHVVLMLDGLRFQTTPLMSLANGCCMDSSAKMLLLRSVHLQGFIGGVVTSDEEEWQYSAEGAVNCLVGQHRIHYMWTGEFLQPSLGKMSVNLGTGKWDGANLYWFPVSAPGEGIKNTLGSYWYEPQPVSHYLYTDTDQEYLTVDATREWKWTRHFLASKTNEAREWIVEGAIPRPVVMLLQMMRDYIRSGSLDNSHFLPRAPATAEPDNGPRKRFVTRSGDRIRPIGRTKSMGHTIDRASLMGTSPIRKKRAK